MKARNYREVKGAAYTRKKYMRGSPQSKIVKFTMGEPSGSYGYRVSLLSEKRIQIRHNALEAARIAANRHLEGKLGQDYFLRVLLYPHVVLRENKMLMVHHADRFQDGMRKAFGKPIGRAARVEPGQPVIVAYVNEDGVEAAKEALKRGGAKLPTRCRMVIKELAE